MHIHKIVFCVALAGSHASISIWKTAAGRCLCRSCSYLLWYLFLMAVFLCSCCPSLGPSLILFLSSKDDFPQSHMSVISIEHICIISGLSKYAVLSAQKNRVMLTFRNLPVIQKSVHSNWKCWRIFLPPVFFLPLAALLHLRKLRIVA